MLSKHFPTKPTLSFLCPPLQLHPGLGKEPWGWQSLSPRCPRCQQPCCQDRGAVPCASARPPGSAAPWRTPAGTWLQGTQSAFNTAFLKRETAHRGSVWVLGGGLGFYYLCSLPRKAPAAYRSSRASPGPGFLILSSKLPFPPASHEHTQHWAAPQHGHGTRETWMRISQLFLLRDWAQINKQS